MALSTLSNVMIKNPKLGMTTKINANYSSAITQKLSNALPQAVDEFVSRANKKGQFLSWDGFLAGQIKRVPEIYDMVAKLKRQSNSKFLSVLGIGGSKHTVEHMLGVNGLNINNDKVLFYSDIDSLSMKRYLNRMDNNILNSNFLIASKSGSTFETKDGMLRVRKMVEDAFKSSGVSEGNAKDLAAKHFIAVTDAADSSQLRELSNNENWIGKLFIHDDVGGRFSALDDHSLFALAWAGMKPNDMIKMLQGAQDVAKIAKDKDVSVNSPLAQAAFWVGAKLNGIKNGVQQYLGDVFASTEKWHTQMQNESLKDTSLQVAKITDAMHHSSEAWYRPGNKFAFSLTAPVDEGAARENVQGYIGAIEKTNSEYGPTMLELLKTKGLGLAPETAGALTQARGYSTVYQEILEKKVLGQPMPEVLESVLQPNVEAYKKNLKPIGDNKPPVTAGKISYSI